MNWYLDEITTEVQEWDGTHAALALGLRGFVLTGESPEAVGSALPATLAARLGGEDGPVRLSLRDGDPKGRATWTVERVHLPKPAIRFHADLAAPVAARLAAEIATGDAKDAEPALSLLVVDLFPSDTLWPEAANRAREGMRASVDDWTEVMRILVTDCGIGPREIAATVGLGISTVLCWCLGRAAPHALSRAGLLDCFGAPIALREKNWKSSRAYEDMRVKEILGST